MTDETDTTAPVPPQPDAAPAPVPAPEVVPEAVLETAQETAPAVAAAVGPDAWALSPEVVQEEQARLPRRRIKLRWAAAALVLLLTGAAAAVAMTSVDRTDLPGLETPNDGRYVFPALALPPLPSGKPSPAASGAGDRHHADLRQLVLPAPTGATLSPAPAPSASAAAVTPAAWKTCDDYAQLGTDPVKSKELLDENACRGAATRVWTAADGTRTEIWLLKFGSADEASAYYQKMNSGDLKGSAGLEYASLKILPAVDASSSVEFTKTTAGAAQEPTGRALYLQSGDVAGLILMTNQQGVPVQAFKQVAILQHSLLN
ncbi:hypothetical protein [Kitasatospora sp. NPDC002040]|uniref:hypothetical protein n=1 Tax=Kitasatospora sp. NPDC002040 TaxID=3154661 RepID=UPI003329FEEE